MNRMFDMRSRLCRVARLLAFVLFLPVGLLAQQIQVTLNPAQTKIEWTLSATMHTVEGTFKLKSATISFDPNSGNTGGEIIVDATSAESGNHMRDSKMHNDVLESKRYPEITFLPKRVIGRLSEQGSSSLQVQGVMHIHGTDHDSTLSVPIQRNGSQIALSTSFVVPYVDWGMKNPGNLFLHVANDVTVKVTATGQLTGAASH